MTRLKLGGKDREFNLSFYAFRVADKRHGVRISGEEFGDISLSDFAKYLWIGLLVSDPDLTEDQVLEWMKSEGPEFTKVCFEAVMEAIGSFGALVSGEEDEDEGKRLDSPSTGSVSSLSRTGS